jgi:hypothetical protein
VNIEHCVFLSWIRKKDQSHEQDGKMLTPTISSRDQNSAILPWLSSLAEDADTLGPRKTGILPSPPNCRIAIGRSQRANKLPASLVIWTRSRAKPLLAVGDQAQITLCAYSDLQNRREPREARTLARPARQRRMLSRSISAL